MPAERKTNHSKRLTTAGLIAVTTATLLMMAWAIFPTSSAFASGTITWEPQRLGSDNLPCASGGFWVFTPGGQNSVTAATLTVNGTLVGPMQQQGNGAWHGTSSGAITSASTASVDFTGDLGANANLTLSHCTSGTLTPDLGITKSATSTQVNEGGAVSYTITVTNTGNGDATGVVVTDDLDNNLTGVTVSASQGTCDPVGVGNTIECDLGTLAAGGSATVTINATAPQLPLTEGGPCTLQLLNQATVDSDQTAPETSNQVTVTVTGTGCEATTTTPPGGGGGGGPTTTPPPAPTTPPTVAPTTIHKSTTTTDEVLPTTVKPGGTAFTGVEDVVPIGAIALMLMTSGSGLLWAGSRRRRHDGSDED